jgi:hypothetical protein
VVALAFLGVQADRATASAPPALAVSAVGGLFGNDRADAPRPQVRQGGTRGVGPITEDRRRPGTWPTTASPRHPQLIHQRLKHRRVMGVTRADEHHQRQPVPVTELVNLGAQPAAGAAHTMISGFLRQIRVIRPCPLCGAPGWRRADRPGRSSNPPPPTNRYRPRHPRWSTTSSRWHPRCRHRRTGDAASTPSATARNPQADRATRAHTDIAHRRSTGCAGTSIN